MKVKILIPACCLLLLCIWENAAAEDSAAVSENKLERLADELQLTADQKAKLEAIFSERHEKIRAIREDTQNRVKKILNEEQFENWETIKKY